MTYQQEDTKQAEVYSNLIIYGQGVKKGGNIKINTILGNSDVGSGDYTFWAEDGDLIGTHAKVKLTPVN